MKKVFLVFEEYRHNGCDMKLKVYVCTTKEIAIKKMKERLGWYLANTYLNNFVDDKFNVVAELDEKYDTWEVNEDSVSIYLDDKITGLNLNITESELIDE